MLPKKASRLGAAL
jgi:hypothetical protein